MIPHLKKDIFLISPTLTGKKKEKQLEVTVFLCYAKTKEDIHIISFSPQVKN